MENRRIIFMGTPKIASVVLKTMLENDIHVGLVVTQPDKKKKSYDFLILHYAISLIAFAKRAF